MPLFVFMTKLKANAERKLVMKAHQSLRRIENHYRGRAHGHVVRMVSPGDLGERLKPFVFLDYFAPVHADDLNFPVHPHSGIGTLTWQRGGDIRYWDSSGQSGVIHAGGLEWMKSGGGAWHQSSALGSGRLIGFQLWVALPPGIEDAQPEGQYIDPSEVPIARISGGEIQVLLGQLEPVSEDIHDDGLERHQSAIKTDQSMNYFIVRLNPAAAWHYNPPADHDIVWVMVFEGEATINGTTSLMEILVLSPDAGAVEIRGGKTESWTVLGTAKKHDYPLVLGRSSVHTNLASLQSSLERIARSIPHDPQVPAQR